jgi:phenylacetic acid degradation operon negative regulatory protein
MAAMPNSDDRQHRHLAPPAEVSAAASGMIGCGTPRDGMKPTPQFDSSYEATGGPQSILTTLLGDYSWQLVAEPLPSALFVELLAAFDVDPRTARVALDRVARKGVLDRVRDGRFVHFRLSKAAAEQRMRRVRALVRFGLDVEAWDGTWTLLLTSVPESRKDLRVKLRVQLSALGFAPFYDAVWVKPNRSSAAVAKSIVNDLDIDRASVFCVTLEGGRGASDPVGCFDTSAVETKYRAFIEEFAKLSASPLRRLGERQALVLRTRLMDTWRSTIRLDPGLPAELLPASFARKRAREVFVRTYDALGPGAEAVLRSISMGCGLPADLPLRHFTSEEVMRGDMPPSLRPRNGRS